jgi:hypothetical protein
MVQLALERLQAEGVVELDEERKAGMQPQQPDGSRRMPRASTGSAARKPMSGRGAGSQPGGQAAFWIDPRTAAADPVAFG